MEKEKLEAEVDHFKTTFKRVHSEVAKFIVGQDEIIENVLIEDCSSEYDINSIRIEVSTYSVYS